MKKVFSSNDEAIHVWANHADRDGRANSVSFGGGVLWSYNTAIAQHVTNERGEHAVIFNDTQYSVTTSKHQGKARYAANHLKRLYISHVGYNTQNLKPLKVGGQLDKHLVEAYETKAAEYLAKASRARTKADDYRAAAFNHLNELKTYAEFFGINYETGDLSKLESAAAEMESRRREREKAAKIQKAIEQAEALEKWRNGENVYSYFEVTALRVKGENIETSRGANIPIEHAIKVWPLLKRLQNSNGVYVRGDHTVHLGYYTLDKFENNTLYVGCHVIPFSEVAMIANQLGL